MNRSDGREHYGLEHHGIINVSNIYWNLSTPALYEEIVRRKEGLIAHLGPIVVRTGHHTARSPDDKLIVKESSSEGRIWWGEINRPFEVVKFDALYHRLLAYLQGKDIFVQDCYAGADPRYSIPIRIISENAWHSLFARSMFVQIGDIDQLRKHVPEFVIIDVPRFHASPELDGTNSEAFIVVNFGERVVLVGGTSYAGEIKKSVFTVLNYLFPQEEVLSMHCAANIGSKEDVALFFGLSGTGKTTLSTDVERRLIGDDEHGWSKHGVFNFEGGCYAKVIGLSAEAEPQIYECTRRFGTILENVAIDSRTRRIDLDNAMLTENTRAAYPIPHIEGSVRSGIGPHPSNIFMLTCDAFGVMPPIAKLTPQQAAYHFLLGYTAKVAGAEAGVGREPEAVFSPCFGAPFMALHPTIYAKLLLQRIIRHKVDCWLVNTGWTGGSFGTGTRMPIAYTRSLVRAAIKGSLAETTMEQDPIFGLNVPSSCEGVPSEILKPWDAWRDTAAYDDQARRLAAAFVKNFERLGSEMPGEVVASGPQVG